MQCNHIVIWTYSFSLHFTFWTAAHSLLRHFTLSYVNSFGPLSRAVPRAGIKWGVRLTAVGISYLKTSDTFLPQTDFPCSSYAKFVKLHSRAKKRRENSLFSRYNVLCSICSNSLSLPKQPYAHVVGARLIVPHGKPLCAALARQLAWVQPHAARQRRSCRWWGSACGGGLWRQPSRGQEQLLPPGRPSTSLGLPQSPGP